MPEPAFTISGYQFFNLTADDRTLSGYTPGQLTDADKMLHTQMEIILSHDPFAYPTHKCERCALCVSCHITLVSTTTPSFREILPTDLPYNDSVYAISLLDPIIRCEEATSMIRVRVYNFLRKGMSGVWGSAEETGIAYFCLCTDAQRF
jgi:hypothetical protein